MASRFRLALFSLVGIVALLCGSRAYATWTTTFQLPQLFFVSNTGNDSNNGLSPSTPWLTIAHVNSVNIPPGAQINLMTNLTGCFNLSFLNSPGPVTIQSYTASLQVTVTCAAATQNFGNNLIGHMFDGVNGITINNVKFVNPNADAGTYGWGGTSNPNYQMGILFQNSANPDPISITFINNVVTGYSSEVAFMFPSAQSNWAVCGAGFNGVTVEFNVLGGTSVAAHDVAGVGFYGTPSAAGGAFCNPNVTNFAQNITINYNTLQFLEGSSTQNNNWPFASTGIMVGNAQNVMIGWNYIHDIGGNMLTCPGPQGTWTGYTNNLTWKFNEVARVGALGGAVANGGCDQHGINLGGQGLGFTVVDNFIHDVNGAGMFLQEVSYNTSGPGWSAVVADNIIENPRWAGILMQNNNDTTHNIQPALIYNNTLILNSGVGGFVSVGTQSNATGSKIYNNIVYAPYLATVGTTVGFLVQTPDTTATTYDYNNYFIADSPTSPPGFKLGATTYSTIAAWKTACACDAHSTFSDPQMTTENLIPDGFNINQVANCSLGLNGPGACPIIGVYAGGAADRTGLAGLASNPQTDYYGNIVPLAPNSPDIGASQISVPRSNIVLDTSITGTTTTLSLTTAGPNELIFVTASTNGAASCTVADGSALTWNQIGVGGASTSIITAWEAFSTAKQTADTITFTCTGQTFISTAALAFKGATGVHDTCTGTPLISATGGPISSVGNNGVIVVFGRSTTAVPALDLGFTAALDSNFSLFEYHLFNVIQSGVTVSSAAGTNGTVADIWH